MSVDFFLPDIVFFFLLFLWLFFFIFCFFFCFWSFVGSLNWFPANFVGFSTGLGFSSGFGRSEQPLMAAKGSVQGFCSKEDNDTGINGA